MARRHHTGILVGVTPTTFFSAYVGVRLEQPLGRAR